MRAGRQPQAGFTILAVLAAMVFLALATTGVMQVVSQQDQREREKLLRRIGETYANAIGSYYESSPGSVKQWPRELDELVEDRRFVGTRRHMRELYADPVARSKSWGVVRGDNGAITGVYSLAEGKPLLSAPLGHDAKPAERYADWEFVYQPKPVGAK
jgi:type II secretory pathway pseudopilin PulG